VVKPNCWASQSRLVLLPKR